MTAPVPADSVSDVLHEVFVGRQAILDRQQETFAYELLYRGRANEGMLADGDQATSRTLLNAFLEIGLEQIAGPHKVFVNLTERFLTAPPPPLPFDKSRIVLEVLETVEVNDRLIESLQALRQDGFTLALDDYEFEEKWEPILPLVDIVKVEVLGKDMSDMAPGVARLKSMGLTILAEKVETMDEFRALHEGGFDLFQGFFFAKPEILGVRRMQENTAIILHLLARLNDPDVELDELESLIEQDPAMSIKILRYLNSAAAGLPRTVESIQQAVVYMGLARIRAWASLFAMAKVDNKPQIIINVALVRANICEQLIRLGGTEAPEKAYTVGLLSITDALLDRPIAEVLKELPLQDDLHDAIANGGGELGAALRCAKLLEQNRPAEVAFGSLSTGEIFSAYIESTNRAFEAMGAIKSG